MEAQESTITEEAVSAAEVTRVSIRVPPFRPKDPALWFSQIEGQFAVNKITSDATKFYYVLSQLESRYAAEVRDICTDPPATDKYATLKKELLRRLSASQEQQFRELLERTEIGDQTPSQFLRTMKGLANDAVTDDFLRTLWASRLPPMTRAIITAQADLPLTRLAAIADQIHDSASPVQVAATSTSSFPEAWLKRFEDLELKICELSRERSRNRQSHQFRSRSRSRSLKRAKSPGVRGHCWYHRKHGKAATKCRAPCTFVAGNE